MAVTHASGNGWAVDDVLLSEDYIAKQTARFALACDVSHPAHQAQGLVLRFVDTRIFLVRPIAVNGTEERVANQLGLGKLIASAAGLPMDSAIGGVLHGVFVELRAPMGFRGRALRLPVSSEYHMIVVPEV